MPTENITVEEEAGQLTVKLPLFRNGYQLRHCLQQSDEESLPSQVGYHKTHLVLKSSLKNSISTKTFIKQQAVLKTVAYVANLFQDEILNDKEFYLRFCNVSKCLM